MQDFVVLVDEHDTVLGEMDKVEAHRGEGVLHRASSVFLLNSNNEILIQQRSEKKITAKGMWANTCCGNVRPGETYEECAQRRLREELGITGVRLARLGVFEYAVKLDDSFSEHEMDTVFVAHADVTPDPNPDEVADWQWVPWEEFLHAVENDSSHRFAPWVHLILDHFSSIFSFLFDIHRVATSNCENCVGSISLPLGVAGPMHMLGGVISGDAYIPLATTEGALVASVSRGIKAINAAGGVRVSSKQRGMTRAPVFAGKDGAMARACAGWIESHGDELGRIAEDTSTHMRFLGVSTWVRGRLVFARFAFDPDQAMGMNMVSIGLQPVVDRIAKEFPDVECLSLSSNLCTDKKDAGINRLLGRGFSVEAECVLPADVLQSILHTTQSDLIRAFEAKHHIGTNLALSFSQNMQVANVVAGMFAATGQDLAHVVDASSATVLMESDGDGVYTAITLPSLPLGVVGGGTWLPAQSLVRKQILGRDITSGELAAVIGAACLAGEISGMSALTTHTLAQAHQRLGRVRKTV